MKVRSVVIQTIDQYGNISVTSMREGVDGVADLHYIVRDGMVCANSRINGMREGYSVPVHHVVDVRTTL
ncbi:hypothetical protein Erwinia_phage_Tapenade_00045 [Erwinia phage Tapenade]|nr:hypothetical protein Erwinia_phage_Tapenade_00045 [Erwinia phage Tapenade]